MTPEQFEHWKDFALRMARTCFRHRKRPNTAWIVKAVVDFFTWIPKEDIVCLVDWDHSDDYPEGHRWYSRKYRCPCWHCSKVPGLPIGQRDPQCRYKCEAGLIYDYADPYPMCDTVSEWETGRIYEQPWGLWNAKERARADSLRNRSDYDAYDEMKEALVEIYAGPVRCCIRAGMDMASAPSAGVLGFTVGHLKRMYDGRIPDWLNEGFNASLVESARGVDLNTELETAGVWL